jgi:hypothetical protein
VHLHTGSIPPPDKSGSLTLPFSRLLFTICLLFVVDICKVELVPVIAQTVDRVVSFAIPIDGQQTKTITHCHLRKGSG